MKDLINCIKFMWKYAEKSKWRIIVYSILNIFCFILNVIAPIASAYVVVSITQNDFQQLLMLGFLLFVINFFSHLCQAGCAYLASKIYNSLYLNLQEDISKNILKLTNETLDKNSSGLFIQRISSDTQKIADVFSSVLDYAESILTNVGVFVAILIINKLLFLYFVLLVIVIYIINNRRLNLWYKNNKTISKKYENNIGFIGELVRGSRDIKMLNSETSFSKHLHKIQKDLRELTQNRNNTNNAYNLARNSLKDASDLIFIIICIILIKNNQISIASALVVWNYSSKISNFITNLNSISQWINELKLSSTRVKDLLDNKKYPIESFGKSHLDKVEGNFEFKKVCFSYKKKDRQILNNMSFKVHANETVAFVGKTGTGKTTIFNLLCKMYEPTSGKITIDGHDIKTLDKDTIRGNITIISQNPYIFNLSIKDNFKLVKEDVTNEEIKEACKLACLDEMINKLPKKYNTIIGEGGVNLSGGEKQRLAIARALVQKTEIILFDEATSALDNETQAHIQQAIDNMKSEYTILIIAHRLSTIINADRILFINEGKVMAEGTHQELLKTCKEYKELYETEIKKRK